jgi:hypothetical protein
MNGKEYYQKVTKLDPEKMLKRRLYSLTYYYEHIQPYKISKTKRLKVKPELPKTKRKRVVNN